jgi:hypothetical protein
MKKVEQRVLHEKIVKFYKPIKDSIFEEFKGMDYYIIDFVFPFEFSIS